MELLRAGDWWGQDLPCGCWPVVGALPLNVDTYTLSDMHGPTPPWHSYTLLFCFVFVAERKLIQLEGGSLLPLVVPTESGAGVPTSGSPLNLRLHGTQSALLPLVTS